MAPTKIKPYLKNLLLTASAKALKLCTPNYTESMSFQKLHEENCRANPEQFCLYKHSILLHSLYNTHKPHLEWLALNFNQNFNSREKILKIFNNSNYKIGKKTCSQID